ncbi:GA45G protein, partial [Polyodon spathula]|nr:GA45G protein [Polyodon spathula]
MICRSWAGVVTLGLPVRGQALTECVWLYHEHPRRSFSPHHSNSPHSSGELKIQWASSDPTTKPASSFTPRNSRVVSVSFCPLEDKGQPCRCPPELTRRLASRVHSSAMRRNSPCRFYPPFGICSKDWQLNTARTQTCAPLTVIHPAYHAAVLLPVLLSSHFWDSSKYETVPKDMKPFEEYECDIALQIHISLIQAFCFDNGIDNVRMNDTHRLAEILGNTDESGAPKDVNCILVMNPSEDTLHDPALEKLSLFCV